jgi:hypothetical protein
MIGLTDRERELAIAQGSPASAFGLALAELSMYWDQHPKGTPDMHQPRLNIRITDEGSPEDRIAAVRAAADWLGVQVTERYGVYIAQRRFGTGDDSIIVECHFTPDQDRTHALIREAGRRKDAPASREDTAELATAAA